MQIFIGFVLEISEFYFSPVIDLLPGYTYPEIGMGYRNGATSQDVQLAEPADLEAVQIEPVEHDPRALSGLGEGLECHAVVRLQEPHDSTVEKDTSLNENGPEFAHGGDVKGLMVMGCSEPLEAKQNEEQAELHICTTVEASICEVEEGLILSSEEKIHPNDFTVTFEEDVDKDVHSTVRKNTETLEDQGAPLVEEHCVSDCTPNQLPDTNNRSDIAITGDEKQQNSCVKVASPAELPETCSQNLVSSYWSLELLIAAAFCGDCPPTSPPSSFSYHKRNAPLNSSCHGMELLSELADLELQQFKQSCGKTQGTIMNNTSLKK